MEQCQGHKDSRFDGASLCDPLSLQQSRCACMNLRSPSFIIMSLMRDFVLGRQEQKLSQQLVSCRIGLEKQKVYDFARHIPLQARLVPLPFNAGCRVAATWVSGYLGCSCCATMVQPVSILLVVP